MTVARPTIKIGGMISVNVQAVSKAWTTRFE